MTNHELLKSMELDKLLERMNENLAGVRDLEYLCILRCFGEDVLRDEETPDANMRCDDFKNCQDCIHAWLSAQENGI